MILFDRLVTGAQTERQGTAVGDEDLSGTAPISSEQAGNAFLLQHSFPAEGIVFAYSIFSNALTNFRFQIWRQDMNGSSVNQFQLIAETSERPSVIGQRQDVNKPSFTRVDKQNKTCLQIAIEKGHRGVVKEILSSSKWKQALSEENIAAKNKPRQTPLRHLMRKMPGTFIVI